MYVKRVDHFAIYTYMLSVIDDDRATHTQLMVSLNGPITHLLAQHLYNAQNHCGMFVCSVSVHAGWIYGVLLHTKITVCDTYICMYDHSAIK